MKIIKSRLFKALIILFIFGLILGIISFFIFDKNNNEIIDYYNIINNNKINYFKTFINSIIYNYKYIFIIWIIGILFFLSFIIPILIIFKGIELSYTVCMIIYTFKVKGLLLSLNLMFISLINNFILLLMSYYSIRFSYKLFNIIKNNKSINIKSFTKNYLFIFLILLSILTINSLLESFVSSNIIKFVL